MTSKSNGNNKVFLALVVLVAIFIIVSVYCDINGVGGKTDLIAVQIPEGATERDIAGILKTNGIIRYPLVYRIKARLEKEVRINQVGEHMLSSSMSYNEIVKSLAEIVSYDAGIKVVVTEGMETYAIAALLAQKNLVDPAIFQQELDFGEFDYPFMQYITRTENRLEGYLFPATYHFSKDMTEYEIIVAMLDKFNQEFDASCYERAQELSYTPDEIITLASIIEREAKDDNDRGKVASVFWNRLNSQDMSLLQSCATVQYVLKERKPVLSNKDTEINSPYNTYKNSGLPIGPIASPGKASIQAALYPETTGYYYFVLGKDGQHVFSRTLAEHNKAISDSQR